MEQSTQGTVAGDVQHVPSLEGIRGRLRFDGPRGSLTMIVDDGQVSLSPAHGVADCVLSAYDAGDLEDIVRGELNMVTAILRGRVRVVGDPLLALRVAGSMKDVGRMVAPFTDAAGIGAGS
ncbi:MAG TPA: SCP2 sterol-binding domain-containing protein [Polyangiaceae bacterium]|nr:SCP2 sterol-binding domain-containing protein [Polyangiaceae bacterium]